MRYTTSLLLAIGLFGACSSPDSTKNAAENKKITSSKRVVEPSQAYQSCQIGSQTWMAQNLNEPHFKNGDPIPEAKTPEEWKKAGNSCQPAWCYYNNDPKNATKFGKLYNWYAVNDPRGLAPKGWRLPGNKEWQILLNELDKQEYDALALQDPSFSGNYPDADALHFHAFASGYRLAGGFFTNAGVYADYWSKDSANAFSANAFHLTNKTIVPQWSNYYKAAGFSVRCLKD
ncbi:MAG: hypothetical protein RLZZ301_191 [Bacteroidota bacterium]|jgi:uncharacterized protein (TIGR02145 family)